MSKTVLYLGNEPHAFVPLSVLRRAAGFLWADPERKPNQYAHLTAKRRCALARELRSYIDPEPRPSELAP